MVVKPAARSTHCLGTAATYRRGGVLGRAGPGRAGPGLLTRTRTRKEMHERMNKKKNNFFFLNQNPENVKKKNKNKK